MLRINYHQFYTISQKIEVQATLPNLFHEARNAQTPKQNKGSTKKKKKPLTVILRKIIGSHKSIQKKTLNEIQHPLMVKGLRKLKIEIEGNFLNLVKALQKAYR